EKKGRSKTHKLKRLYKIGSKARVASSDDESLGEEDASKQGRKIDDIYADEGITLVNETTEDQGRFNDEMMFYVSDLAGEEVVVAEKGVPKAKDDVVSSTDVATTISTAATTVTHEEITLAQALQELKIAKPKSKGIIFKEPVESTTITPTPIPLKIQDKGKGIMEEPEKLTKRKDQIRHDEEMALKLQAQMHAELEEEERPEREKEEEANIVSWDNVQAMIDADYQMALKLQAQEQKELTIKEKSKMFVQLLEARKKHVAALRAEEKRNKPPTKAQKRNTMCTYLKNMVGYKHNQLKNKSFDDIQKLFDREMKRVNTFVDIDIELVEESSKKAEAEIAHEGSSKRKGTELEQEESAKKQKVDEAQETAKMKEHIRVVPDEEEVAIDAIPLATKPPSIMYKVFSQLLKSFDMEDLETLWRLVKAKHGYIRPEEGYERVLWGDLKTMFEPHVEDAVWRNLQGNRVLIWKLFDSCGVNFVRFQSLHIYMLVEKKYPLTPATITDMLNKKLQADYWNEMCYQLLKLITK
ncbi:hypothetical protein Tco_1100450, partial [Tanacetum coccineum]